MVRLKEKNFDLIEGSNKFQFLMVIKRFLFIKINGSSSFHLMVRLKAIIFVLHPQLAISIPYGAIKSCKSIFTFLDLNLFQFLMVWLKVNFKACLITVFMISIPYGAIKRVFKVYLHFHHLHFNSLWCD